MTIGELAALSNLKPSAIRFYEKTGLLPAPARKNGRRVYSSEAANRLTLIGFAKDTGFSLPEIKLLLHGFLPPLRPAIAGASWRPPRSGNSRPASPRPAPYRACFVRL